MTKKIKKITKQRNKILNQHKLCSTYRIPQGKGWNAHTHKMNKTTKDRNK